MASLLIEQLTSGSASEDPIGGRKTTSRTFKAPSISIPSVARDAFYNEGHASDPTNPSLILSGLTAERLPSGAGCVVTAQYSTRGDSQFDPPRDDPNYYHYGWGERDVKVSLPFSQYVRKVLNENRPDGTWLWELRTVEYTETRVLRIFKARVKGLPITAFDPIATEKRKIHTIYGADLLFLGGTISEVDGESFDVSYTWEIDPGSPLSSQNGQYRHDVEYPIVSNSPQLLRLPYTATLPVPPADPTQGPFTAIPFYPYVRNPDGWQRLPGTDRL